MSHKQIGNCVKSVVLILQVKVQNHKARFKSLNRGRVQASYVLNIKGKNRGLTMGEQAFRGEGKKSEVQETCQCQIVVFHVFCSPAFSQCFLDFVVI